MAFGRKGEDGERSAEERARAAAERAARRAQPPPPAETFQETVRPPAPERRDETYDLEWEEPAAPPP